MNKRKLYKRFLKLGVRIDNLLFTDIGINTVEKAVQNLVAVIKSDDEINSKNVNVIEFVERFYKIEQILLYNLQASRKIIRSSEFKDCNLIVRLEEKHKSNQLASVYNAMCDFNVEFFNTYGISLGKIKNDIESEELEIQK